MPKKSGCHLIEFQTVKRLNYKSSRLYSPDFQAVFERFKNQVFKDHSSGILLPEIQSNNIASLQAICLKFCIPVYV